MTHLRQIMLEELERRRDALSAHLGHDSLCHGSTPDRSAHLKVSDVDSERMVVHIPGGKGRKYRDVMLSPALLEELRTHWRGLRRKPTLWLFPATGGTLSLPVTTWVLCTAGQQAVLRAGPEHEHIHPHILRHCFATHLLEAGRISAPSRSCSVIATSKKPPSLHLSQKHLSATASPIDMLALATSGEALRSA